MTMARVAHMADFNLWHEENPQQMDVGGSWLIVFDQPNIKSYRELSADPWVEIFCLWSSSSSYTHFELINWTILS